VQAERAYIAEVVKLMEYVESKEDPLTQIVRKHEHHINSTSLKIFRNFKNKVWSVCVSGMMMRSARLSECC
jgi:hypothetical protein